MDNLKPRCSGKGVVVKLFVHDNNNNNNNNNNSNNNNNNNNSLYFKKSPDTARVCLYMIVGY